MAENFKSLVKAAKKGDQHSFAVLYSEIYKDLYKYAFFTLRSVEDAEDCVSEAVVDAFRTIGNLKNEESFRAWFFKILTVKCKRKIKEYYKNTDDNAILTADFDDVDTSIDLQRALFLLPAQDRIIISLTVFGGYSSKEISKILRMNCNTVRSKYSRALVKIRNLIED